MSPTQEMELPTPAAAAPPNPARLLLLRLLNIVLMSLGIGGGLLLRLYYIYGGSRLWVSTLLQVAGWPVLLIPIFLHSFIDNRRAFQLSPSVFVSTALIGIFYGLSSFFYSFGSSYLPFSTSCILLATNLSFIAAFSFFINRQHLTPYSLNSVVLLTIGSIVLGLSSGNDRPRGESNGQYILGFVMTLSSAALLGLLLTVMERVYKMVKEGLNYGMIMEIQLVTGVFGSGFCLVGMAINKDFQAIAREARDFDLGETKYYIVLLSIAILCQLNNLGIVGTVCCSSSLFAGIATAVLLPVGEILAVILFHEKFNGSKGIALVLSLWGFASYLYGEKKQSRKQKKLEVELPSPA